MSEDMGPGCFRKRITLGSLTFGAQERVNILQVMANNWVSPGPFVAEFENKFSAYHDCQYGIMVNSGTDALRLALLAMKEQYGWRNGDEVIVPALTFVATVNIILQCNLKPVFVDVDPKDLNINTHLLPNALSRRTVAIIPVHLFGNPCNMEQVMLFAHVNKLKVLEDSCECMGVRWGDRTVGSWGDAGAFSTYACHLIATGVGGLVTTNDLALADLIRSYMNHGRRSEKQEDRFVFERVGYSARPDEFQAAIGLAQLSKLHQWIDQRRRNAFHLSERLDGSNFWTLPTTTEGHEKAWMMYPVVLNRAYLDREKFCAFLDGRGIETRPLFPLLTQPVFKGLFDAERFPVALRASKHGFYVGCHQDLDEKDMASIANALMEAVHKYSRDSVAA